MKSISLSSLGERYADSWKRFPIPHAMLSLLVLVLCFKVLFPKAMSDTVYLGAWLFPSVGFLIALARDLRRDAGALRHGRLTDLIGLAAWAGIVVWICRHYQDVASGYLAVSVAVLAVVAGLTAPFLKDKDDERLFRGTCDILRDGFSAGIVAGILLFGICALILFIESFFVKSGSVDKLYALAAILAGLAVFGVLFLVRIPKPWPSEEGLSRFARGAVRYLFLPLLGLYLLTLYVYAGRILFDWKLPDGNVSWLVTASMALMLVVAFALNPWARDDRQGVLRTVVRLLPWLVLPLLALMSVGIIRRVRDYGWTVDRVYLALFNLWCYGVCIYLILNGCRRLRWVPLSFALILFFASFGPWNVSSSVRRTLQRQVREMLGETPLPATLQDIEGLDSMTAIRLREKLAYLKDTFGKEAVDAYIEEPSEPAAPDNSDVKEFRRHSNMNELGMEVPEGYGRVQLAFHPRVRLVSFSEESFRIELVREGVPLRFDIPMSGQPMPLMVEECEGKAVLQLGEIFIYKDSFLRVKAGELPEPSRSDGALVGLLFLK